MKWPWVSRAKYEAALVELEAERKRARRRERRQLDHSADAGKVIDMADATADTSDGKLAGSTIGAAVKPDPVATAIRAVSGNDRVLARHLRTYAAEQRLLEVPDHVIAKRIRDGQEVRL